MGCQNGFGQTLRAEGGVEADKAGVHAEQETAGGGGQREVGSDGATASPEQVGERADGQHADTKEGERATEEAHGCSGEIEEVAEGEGVVAALGEQGGDVGVWVGVGRGDREEERDGGAE